MKYLWSTVQTALLMVTITTTETVKCPRYCTCYLDPTYNMRSVSCVARRLDNIDLSVPKRVQSLNLSNNSISVLEDRGFQDLGLIEIIKLIISHNSIRTIGLHTFAGLVYLEWVDLSDNNLYQILPWTFHDNGNLKFISLSSNPLGHITPPGPFLDIPSLEVLELSKCNFAHFSEDSFSALPNLKKLDISDNQLIDFEMYPIHFLHYLEELDVSKNPWPCNTNLRNIKEFLNSKSASLIESSCYSKEMLQTIHIAPAKFERIVSVGVYPEYEEIRNHDDDVKYQEDYLQRNTVCNCQSGNKTVYLHEKYSILPQHWLVLVSFQLGVAVTLIVVYFWTYCTKNKSKYHSLEQSMAVTPALIAPQPFLENTLQMEEQSVETMSCPETPPPSYRELFMSNVS